MTTFKEYITQRRAFGRTPWLRAILIWGLSGALIVYGVWILVERDLWGLAPLLVGIGVRCILGFGTKANWETDKAREEKGPNNRHYPDVCEYCNPPCMDNGEPIGWLVWWLAAIRHIDREEAALIFDDAPLKEQNEFRRQYAKYLANPKFRKFKTK